MAPDGGYGWIVVAASFLVNMIADGVTFSFGVMFEEFEQEGVHTCEGIMENVTARPIYFCFSNVYN